MSNDEKVELKLSNRPDGYGFFYGTASLGNELVNVSVMPPKDQWNGDMELEGYTPDPEQWILYADGNEIARVEAKTEIEEVLLPRLERKIVPL